MPKIAIMGTGARPYTIAMVGQNDAEINMYGEVVQTRPTDWWTGDPIPGNFIAVDEFLSELDSLSSKDNITIHINSVGGDFYAGLAIYNRLRSLKASITTINDGLAASAGSIIFMAGDKGKRKANAGSNLMIHGVLVFMYGYYNAGDIKTSLKEVEAHNKAAIAVYEEATGLPTDTIKAAMSKDTYMTGQEAVDAGWADEVITGEGSEPVNMKLTPDKSCLMVNGHAVAACLFGKLPESIPQMSAEEFAALSAPASGTEPPYNSAKPAPQDGNITKNGGFEEMEIKTVDEMRQAFPEFCASIENEARNAGVLAERARIQGIEDIQNAVGNAEMIRDAKFGEKPMNAQELAFAAMKAQAAVGAAVVNAMAADAQASGAADVTAAANGAAGSEGKEDSPETMAAQAKADADLYKKMKEAK